MYDPMQYDPNQVYSAQSLYGGNPQPQAYGQTVGAAVNPINPQQPSMQQKLAMMLMQQNGGLQGQPPQTVGANGQNPQGQTSPYSSIAQLGQMFMGGMGGGA